MANKKNEELVSVFIPKQSRNDTERFVAVNGERILVQTGKTVEVADGAISSGRAIPFELIHIKKGVV